MECRRRPRWAELQNEAESGRVAREGVRRSGYLQDEANFPNAVDKRHAQSRPFPVSSRLKCTALAGGSDGKTFKISANVL